MDRGGLGHEVGAQEQQTGERYLPRKAREALSDEEYARTTNKKRKDTAKGKQFSARPEDVQRKTAKYRKSNGSAATKAELYQEAKRRGIEGRSKMSKAELAKALGR